MENGSIQATNKVQEILRSWKDEAVRNYNRQILTDYKVELQFLEELCKVGANLNYLEQERGFALIPNVFWSKELIQFFVDRGANVNSQDEKGDTALHLVIRHAQYKNGNGGGHASDLVHYLVNELNADPNVTNLRGETPLFGLAKSMGAEMSFPPKYSDDTYAHQLKLDDIKEIPKLLVERGADVTICDGDDESVLHKCVYNINTPLIHKFEGGVDVKTSNWLYSKTPLMVSIVTTDSCHADKNCLCSCRVFLNEGADVNARDLQGYTALHHAVLNGAHWSAEFLLGMGANPMLKSISGKDVYDMNLYRPTVSSYLSDELFIQGAPPRKQVDILEIVGAMMVMKDLRNRSVQDAINLWYKAVNIRVKFNLQVSTKDRKVNLLKLIRQIQTDSNREEQSEEIRLSAMKTVAMLSKGSYAQFWNFLYSIPEAEDCKESWYVFKVLNFLSEELKRVENFASFEEIDFYSLSELVEFFAIWLKGLVESEELESKNEALTPERISHVHSIARLIIACFNKLTHVTNSNKVTETCKELYVTLCLVLTSLHSRFADVMTETDFNVNKRLLKTLIGLDLRDRDSNSLMHHIIKTLIPSNYAIQFDSILSALRNFYKLLNKKIKNRMRFESDLLGALLDDFELNVKMKNRLGFEPVQLMVIYEAEMDEPFLNDVLVKMADRGAHVDARNATCNKPTLREVFEKKGRQDLAFHYDSLQCACARVLVRSLVPYKNRVPQNMVDFIRMHSQ